MPDASLAPLLQVTTLLSDYNPKAGAAAQAAVAELQQQVNSQGAAVKQVSHLLEVISRWFVHILQTVTYSAAQGSGSACQQTGACPNWVRPLLAAMLPQPHHLPASTPTLSQVYVTHPPGAHTTYRPLNPKP
jgi:hypothetical protein